MLVLNFQIDDNPSLSPEIIESYKRMYKGTFYRRYILGEWCGAEGSLFIDPPKIFTEPNLLFDGIAHIDASYGGGDFTAFTCGKRVGDTIYAYGKIWHAHVDTVMEAIIADAERLRCAPIFCEVNADKGYLAKELKNRGVEARMYSEYMNKYVKISTYLNKWWSNVQFLNGTDDAYISQIMDYTLEAPHDDSVDSLACVVRQLDRVAVSL